MIFGFNTDIKHEGTVYHVQSEARQHDLLLQTQVFVRGRCIGKHATSYAEKVAQEDFSDEQMHDLLKSQHKSVIEAIRAGDLEQFLGEPALAEKTQKIPVMANNPAPAGMNELALEWLNSNALYEQNAIIMKFAVRMGAAGVSGALLVSRLNLGAVTPVYARAQTGEDGVAEMRVEVDEAALEEASILVQATHEGRQATRKFRLRRH